MMEDLRKVMKAHLHCQAGIQEDACAALAELFDNGNNRAIAARTGPMKCVQGAILAHQEVDGVMIHGAVAVRAPWPKA